MNLGVVGYPGDRLSPGDSAYGEHMYEMFLPTEFDLATSNRLLQYDIDTFGGNSGSPVLVKDDMRAIGVHVLGGNSNSASVIGALGNVFQQYEGSFLAKPDPAYDITTKVPSRVKSFRVVSIPSKNERDSGSSNIKKATNTESLTESTGLFNALRSLLDSSVRAHEDPGHFLGQLQSLLEPSMVNAMSDACNGAEGLVTALQFLWHSNKDNPANSESLLTTLAKDAKHKVTVRKVLKIGEKIGEVSPVGRVLRFGLDAANAIGSSNDESLMDHIATGLSVTVPMVNKEYPKLGSIGVPVAALAASALRSVGAEAAASLSSDSEPSNSAPEGALARESVSKGANERALLAETALHGIMRLPPRDLKQNQVYEKMHAIIKPLAHIVRRADPMLSLIMQPTITKVALASLKTPDMSPDASQGTPATPQSPSPSPESLTYKRVGGIRPKIGVSVPSASSIGTETNNTCPAQAMTQDSTPVDEPLSAFTEALMAAHPDLEDTLPEMVKRGMQLDNGAFSNAIMFGLPILLGGDLESQFYDRNAGSAVAVSGLAQRAMLAEAALQVMLQLPVDVIRTLDVPDMRPTIDAFKTKGEDEAEQASQLPLQVAAGISATAASVAALSSATSTYLTHADKKEDRTQTETEISLTRAAQLQKDKEIALTKKAQEQRDTEIELSKIGQNMNAKINGLEQPHKDVTHYHPETGAVIHPEPAGGEGPSGPPPPKGETSKRAPISKGKEPQEAGETHKAEEPPAHQTAPAHVGSSSNKPEPSSGGEGPSGHDPPKEEEAKPKAGEPISKGEEPQKAEETHKAEEPPVHAGSSSTKSKEEVSGPKKPPGFAAPTASSIARRASAEGKKARTDPESLIAEDFISGFADM